MQLWACPLAGGSFLPSRYNSTYTSAAQASALCCHVASSDRMLLCFLVACRFPYAQRPVPTRPICPHVFYCSGPTHAMFPVSASILLDICPRRPVLPSSPSPLPNLDSLLYLTWTTVHATTRSVCWGVCIVAQTTSISCSALIRAWASAPSGVGDVRESGGREHT